MSLTAFQKKSGNRLFRSVHVCCRIILLITYPGSGFSNPHFNSEIAVGEANVADVVATIGFAYNPSVIASNRSVQHSPFFIEHSFNKDGQQTLSKWQKLSKLSDGEVVRAVDDLTGMNLHFDTIIGGSILINNMAFAVVPSLSYDSIIRGHGLPILELAVVESVELFLTAGYEIIHDLKLGASIKPTYRLEHYLEKATAEVVDNPKSINPQRNGKKGWGFGLDLGFSWSTEIKENHHVKLGGGLLDIGDTSFNLRKETSEAPPPVLFSSNTGITYTYSLPEIEYLRSVDAMYSYYFLQDKFGNVAFPHRLGVRLNFEYGLELLFGSYKRLNSIGIQFRYKAMTVNYITFRETTSNISVDQSDRRHGLAFHLLF